jgi:hypothetical protein
MELKINGNIGDTIYHLKTIKRIECPVCGGNGTIRLGHSVTKDCHSLAEAVDKMTDSFLNVLMNPDAVKTYVCPECRGKKTIKASGQIKYQIEQAVIEMMEANVLPDGRVATIYYVRSETNNVLKLMEDNIYFSLEDAQKDCEYFNLERRNVLLTDVKITSSFAKTQPRNEKLNKRLDEYRSHGACETPILVDENMVLFDGYTSYLVYKMFGVEKIPVTIWPNNLRFKNKQQNDNAEDNETVA